MTPSKEEVEAALGCGVPCAGYHCDCKTVLAAALRQAEAENASMREALNIIANREVDYDSDITEGRAVAAFASKAICAR